MNTIEPNTSPLVVVLSLALNTLIGAVLLYVGCNLILANMSFLSEVERNGVKNPFDDLMGISFLYLAPAYLLYYLFALVFNRFFADRRSRFVLGPLAALIPFTLLQMATFGFGTGTLMIVITLLILGALIPLLEAWLGKALVKGNEHIDPY